MSYLDKAKSVSSQTLGKPVESKPYELNELTNKASQTVQTPSEGLRNNLLEAVTAVATPQQGVTIPGRPESLPRLPWQLERLVSAACADVLPETVMLSSGFVPDLNRCTLGWAAAYLVGDRDEAARRLWEAYGLWKGKLN